MSSLTLTSRRRVRSCEVDSFGHVNNAVYLQYLEGARNDYLLERGLVFADFARWNAGPVLVSARLDFKAPSRTDDELLILGCLEFRGRLRFQIEHEIQRPGDGVVIASALLEFAFVDLTTGRPCRVPDGFRSAFDAPRTGGR